MKGLSFLFYHNIVVLYSLPFCGVGPIYVLFFPSPQGEKESSALSEQFCFIAVSTEPSRELMSSFLFYQGVIDLSNFNLCVLC